MDGEKSGKSLVKGSTMAFRRITLAAVTGALVVLSLGAPTARADKGDFPPRCVRVVIGTGPDAPYIQVCPLDETAP